MLQRAIVGEGSSENGHLASSGKIITPFIKMLRKGVLLAVHGRLDTSPDHLVPPYETPPFGVGDAYMCAVHLRPMERADIWRGGRFLGSVQSPEGALQIYDLRHSWRAVLHPPFETMNFRIEQATLDAVAREAGRTQMPVPPRFEESRPDPVMHRLAMALLPAFHRPGELSALFAEHIGAAVAAHIAGLDGPSGRGSIRHRGGLAPWQQRRVTDIMQNRIDADITLDELAAACGLSPGHFAKCFRTSFGLPPHRWLLRERVQRAAEMIRNGQSGLDEVAVACGFVDQSHLGRVFRTVMNTTPAAWRRGQEDHELRFDLGSAGSR